MSGIGLSWRSSENWSRSLEQQPESPLRPAQVGCGCALPGSGLLLLLLTVVLAVLIARTTSGYSPLWLLLAPLVLGMLILFFRVWGSRGGR